MTGYGCSDQQLTCNLGSSLCWHSHASVCLERIKCNSLKRGDPLWRWARVPSVYVLGGLSPPVYNLRVPGQWRRARHVFVREYHQHVHAFHGFQRYLGH
eukprot:COSAG02_NODE_18808_length_917_cov_4.328851_1_plen_99_part_00